MKDTTTRASKHLEGYNYNMYYQRKKQDHTLWLFEGDEKQNASAENVQTANP